VTPPLDARPCAKGTALVDLVRIAAQERDTYAPLLLAETLAFLDTDVLPGSWYPERYLRDLLLATDRLRGRGDLSHCREVLGPRSAAKDLQGVYRALLKTGDPARTLQALPILWSLYHDSGLVSLDAGPANGITLFIEGFGLPSEALCATCEGWMLEAVRLAGGASPAVSHDMCVSRGAGACRFQVSWSSMERP
jgi:hypothetical protein